MPKNRTQATEPEIRITVTYLPVSNWCDYAIETPSGEKLGGGGEANSFEQALQMVTDAWEEAHEADDDASYRDLVDTYQRARERFENWPRPGEA